MSASPETWDGGALPCPHCGTEPLRCFIPPHGHSDGLKRLIPDLPDHPGSYTIECAGCSAAMIDHSRDGVLARWNLRAPDAAAVQAERAAGAKAMRLETSNIAACLRDLASDLDTDDPPAHENCVGFSKICTELAERIDALFTPDALAAAIRAAADGEWLPFDTAPKDGTVIIVHRDDAGVFTAHFVEADAHLATPARPPEGDACWFSTCGDDLTGDLPTEWQPMPEPPARRPAGEGGRP